MSQEKDTSEIQLDGVCELFVKKSSLLAFGPHVSVFPRLKTVVQLIRLIMRAFMGCTATKYLE
jgi:hypothetical protein